MVNQKNSALNSILGPGKGEAEDEQPQSISLRANEVCRFSSGEEENATVRSWFNFKGGRSKCRTIRD
ncbi:MAG: hypothetical protein DME65_12735 [Verrucomicrobia bacterium]|nr:MAG: hypothetical protein DME65_12735 [Verrucomicrobiota bacterium]